jgi:hypothetical protein
MSSMDNHCFGLEGIVQWSSDQILGSTPSTTKKFIYIKVNEVLSLAKAGESFGGEIKEGSGRKRT